MPIELPGLRSESMIRSSSRRATCADLLIVKGRSCSAIGPGAPMKDRLAALGEGGEPLAVVVRLQDLDDGARARARARPRAVAIQAPVDDVASAARRCARDRAATSRGEGQARGPSARPASTTSLTRPQAAARPAGIGSPEYIISSARAVPISRGRRCGAAGAGDGADARLGQAERRVSTRRSAGRRRARARARRRARRR